MRPPAPGCPLSATEPSPLTHWGSLAPAPTQHQRACQEKEGWGWPSTSEVKSCQQLLTWVGTLLLSESSYSCQTLPCPSMDRNPLPTGEGPAYHSCSAAFNDFDLCLGYWQVLPVQSKKSSSFHHPHRSFHFKNNAFQCQLGQQLLLED